MAKRSRRIKRGRKELAELKWGDSYAKDYDDTEDWEAPEDEEYAAEDGDWDDEEFEDWDDEWEPPPGGWEEDDLD